MPPVNPMTIQTHTPTEGYLPLLHSQIAIRAAGEGVPTLAIARILNYPLDTVTNTLKEAQTQGALTFLPKYDWGPKNSLEDRTPAHSAALLDANLTFAIQHRFRLTNLEAAILVALLRADRIEKTGLHRIIEQQRVERTQRANDLTPTDIKMVDVMICKLRAKLKAVDERFVINTIWGTGYHIEPSVSALIIAVGSIGHGTTGC